MKKETIIDKLSSQEKKIYGLDYIVWPLKVFNKIKRRNLIYKFLDDIKIDSDYNYDMMREFAQLYHYLKNIAFLDLPYIKHPQFNSVILSPIVSGVLSGDDYIEIRISFKKVKGNKNFPDELYYRFIFRNDNSIDLYKEEVISSDDGENKYKYETTVQNKIMVGTVEHRLLEVSFIEYIKLLVNRYLTL